MITVCKILFGILVLLFVKQSMAQLKKKEYYDCLEDECGGLSWRNPCNDECHIKVYGYDDHEVSKGETVYYECKDKCSGHVEHDCHCYDRCMDTCGFPDLKCPVICTTLRSGEQITKQIDRDFGRK